ncbi:MAG: GtrA family protein [Actinomycetaceae bacterium]|nr:GtrA family protein [Actinomycetaceae bacterium]
MSTNAPKVSPLLWLLKFLQNNRVEITKFLTVGGANYVVDLSIFNLLRLVISPGTPVADKVISVGIATLFSWVVNRSWTFKGKATKKPLREVVLFALVNVAGMLPSLLCIWVSHYLLGFTSALADNISGNVIGLVLGTILRYACYKSFVFTGK